MRVWPAHWSSRFQLSSLPAHVHLDWLPQPHWWLEPVAVPGWEFDQNGEVLEAVNDVKTVIFDKTGTITVGKPQVTDVIGDKDQVLRIAASLEESSEHPLATAIIKKNQWI